MWSQGDTFNVVQHLLRLLNLDWSARPGQDAMSNLEPHNGSTILRKLRMTA